MGQYQRIEIDGVVYIEGPDRMPQYRAIFLEPPAGKTILDIGCNTGFYGFQAIKEGALSYLGIDNKGKHLRQARLIADKLDTGKTQFMAINVIGATLPGEHDVVLCLNILHHMPDIKTVIDVLFEIDRITRERMVFSVLTPYDNKAWSTHKQRKHRFGLAPKFFEAIWPNYTITSERAKTKGPRTIVDVRK